MQCSGLLHTKADRPDRKTEVVAWVTLGRPLFAEETKTSRELPMPAKPRKCRVLTESCNRKGTQRPLRFLEISGFPVVKNVLLSGLCNRT